MTTLGQEPPGALRAAQQKWDTEDTSLARRVAWLSLERVNDEVWNRFSAGANPGAYVSKILAQHGQSQGCAGAALVCGDMQSERLLFEKLPHVAFHHVDGFDISAESMNRYQPDGVAFHAHQVDCNRLDLPVGAYDLVVVHHGAHHVYNLGNLFYQANKSLKDHGLLYMWEWIGPEFLQLPWRNRVAVTFLLLALFSQRERTTHMGKSKGLRYLQERPETFDPSEACNSTELYQQFERYFHPINAHFHGALAYPMFEGIAQNLDQSDARTAGKIDLVLGIERLLTKLRLVAPLFVVALGRKRPGVF